MRYGTALRDLEPLIRRVLAEQGMPTAERDARSRSGWQWFCVRSQPGRWQCGESFGFFMSAVPAWDDQSEQQRALVLALNGRAEATTLEEQVRTADGARATAVRWA